MTAHQLVRISLDQLKPGMYINNVFNSRGVLLYCANTLIQNQMQIEALRRQGVTELNINLEKGTGSDLISTTPLTETTQSQENITETPRQEIFTEVNIQKARLVRQHAVESIQSIMTSAKIGRIFSIQSIVSSVESIIDSMIDDPELLLSVSKLQTHSEEAYVHSVNVAVLMIGFASGLGYSHDKILAAGIGGMLHDIGLVSLPEDLFMKQGTCTRQEQELYKNHPTLGLEIIKRNKNILPNGVHQIISQHHERMNGCGYPAKLSGTNIDDLAIVCAIADMYDTLTMKGIFNKTYLPQEALALIFQGSDEEFPRSFVEHFTKLLGIYPVGSFVKLDTGEMGVVVKNNRKKLLAPTVRILFDASSNRIHTPYLKDLSVTDVHSDDQLTRILHSLDPSSFKVETENFIIRYDSN